MAVLARRAGLAAVDYMGILGNDAPAAHTTPSPPWPTEVRLNKAKDALIVAFDDGQTFELPAEMLRVMSPSAEVQGHSKEQRVTVGGKRNVKIKELRGVGNYAVRIVFDDGHDTGLFTWDYLHQLGRDKTKRWFEYEQRLKAAGLNRDAA